jgi:hypothetical protein
LTAGYFVPDAWRESTYLLDLEKSMKLNKSFAFLIESVTVLTLLKATLSVSLTQRNFKRASQKHKENSITLREINYDNSDYLSYGNEIYDTHYYNNNNPIQASYNNNNKEKDSKYSQSSSSSSKKHLFNNYEQYPSNTERQQQEKKEEKVLVDNANSIQTQTNSARMSWNTLVVSVVVVLIIIVLIAIGCGIFMICKKDNPETGPGYSVAVSNRLFKEGTDGNDLPCLNCRLIEMGEMACYTERCPQCGNVPPCRKELYPDEREQRERGKRQQRQQKPNQQQLQNSSTVVTYSAASRDVQNNRTTSGIMTRGEGGYYMQQQNSNMV